MKQTIKTPALSQKSLHAEADKILNSILHEDHSTHVVRPALLKDGILRLNAVQRRRYSKKFKKTARDLTYTEFIPASGAGSRLLKSLISFAQDYNPEAESVSYYINRTASFNLNTFFHHLKNLPFYSVIQNEIVTISERVEDINLKRLHIVQFILETPLLDLKNLPKALVPIHKSKFKIRNACDEHLEIQENLSSYFSKSKLVFSVDPSQLKRFQDYWSNQKHHHQNLEVEFSIQDPESEVYCLNKNQSLLIDDDGIPIKRPSGHGALLHNLNDIDSNIVYISNVDNVPNKRNHKAYITHKKIMMGYVMSATDQVHNFLQKLEDGNMDALEIKKLAKFLKKYFHLNLNSILDQSNEGTLSTIYHLLNAPVRVAAMIPAASYSGGGPFWVKNSKGIEALQIVESVEIDSHNLIQKSISEQSTHFNPVSMCVSLKDYQGVKFDLTEFAAHHPTMVIYKTFNGKEIRFLEQTGLWNGKMKGHLTIFIQASNKIFNPIKELTDVFNENHISHD